MTYTGHKKTSGLGTIVSKGGIRKKLLTEGLIMHTSFAVTMLHAREAKRWRAVLGSHSIF